MNCWFLCVSLFVDLISNDCAIDVFVGGVLARKGLFKAGTMRVRIFTACEIRPINIYESCLPTDFLNTINQFVKRDIQKFDSGLTNFGIGSGSEAESSRPLRRRWGYFLMDSLSSLYLRDRRLIWRSSAVLFLSPRESSRAFSM
jgi:hypothetical protein